MRLSYFLGVFCLFIISFQSLGQLIQKPIRLHPNQQEGKHNQRRTSVLLDIPFFDDFSDFQTGFPDSTRWEQGGGVYVNNSFGIQMISIGVATFDGQDETGANYNPESSSSIGEADKLTSHCFDLSPTSGNSIADSLILSFYWQAKGLGELPNREDAFVLQFKDSTDTWRTEWSVAGDTLTDFIKEDIRVNDGRYFHEDFQFRFVSFGRLSGGYDTWNLDYIYFDKKDSIGSTIQLDVAIAEQPTSIFTDYTEIPFSHFAAYPDTLIKDSTSVDFSKGSG